MSEANLDPGHELQWPISNLGTDCGLKLTAENSFWLDGVLYNLFFSQKDGEHRISFSPAHRAQLSAPPPGLK